MQFIKTGKATHESLAKAEAITEAKKAAAASGLFRFWIKEGAETQITFLDGVLEDGLLQAASTDEHMVRINGKWHNFLCIAAEEACPICENGDSPAWIAVLTVIDHSKYEDKNGKVHQHTRKLFVCKRDTFKKLQKYANKHKGLAGCTFDVSRTGEKSPAVGSDFDFVEKLPISEIVKKYGLKAEEAQPADYEKAFKVLTAKELRELGFGGEAAAAVGTHDTKAVGKNTDYDKEL